MLARGFDILTHSMRKTHLILALCALLPQAFGQGRNYGRSMVITKQGIAATCHTLATQAAAQILARGGSAVDAANTANTVLGEVEPMMNGPGGDIFAIYWDSKTGKLTGLNGSGPAPKGLSPKFLADQGVKTMPADGIHSVTVPGAVDGWWKMHQRFGTLPWKDLFHWCGDRLCRVQRDLPVTDGIAEAWGSPSTTGRCTR